MSAGDPDEGKPARVPGKDRRCCLHCEAFWDGDPDETLKLGRQHVRDEHPEINRLGRGEGSKYTFFVRVPNKAKPSEMEGDLRDHRMKLIATWKGPTPRALLTACLAHMRAFGLDDEANQMERSFRSIQ